MYYVSECLKRNQRCRKRSKVGDQIVGIGQSFVSLSDTTLKLFITQWPSLQLKMYPAASAIQIKPTITTNVGPLSRYTASIYSTLGCCLGCFDNLGWLGGIPFIHVWIKCFKSKVAHYISADLYRSWISALSLHFSIAESCIRCHGNSNNAFLVTKKCALFTSTPPSPLYLQDV